MSKQFINPLPPFNGPLTTVTHDQVDRVVSYWEQGYAVVVSRVNRILGELFVDPPKLQPSAKAPAARGGLNFFCGLFREALPFELFDQIPNSVRIRGRTRGDQRKFERMVDVRDDNQVYPWSIGYVPLGKDMENPDLHYLELARELRASDHDAEWFETNVVKPTEAHAACWRRLFEHWRWQLSQQQPPDNLSPSQLDIWNVVVEAGHRLTGDQIYDKLAEKGLTPSRGMLKQNLAELSRRGILPNRRDTTPPGYGLPEWD